MDYGIIYNATPPPSVDTRRAVLSYLQKNVQKNVHLVLVSRLEVYGVGRLTDRVDMTLKVSKQT